MSQPAVTAPPGDSAAAPSRTDPALHTAGFFNALLDAAPADHHTLLWTLQDKLSTWVPLDAGAPPVSTAARSLAEAGRDVYVAVSLAARPGLRDTRIRGDNSAGIMGLWADIDIADPDVHKKWNLPPTQDAATELLAATELPPSLIVHSGHGLQAWWLFNEFWAFDGEQPRLEAYGLAQRWNGTLQARAAEKSWVVDSTFDLARVMRVPGTLNRKGAPVMPVKLLVEDGPRYNPDDFDDYIVDPAFLASRGITPTRAYKPDRFTLSESNAPDFDRFQALRDNDPKFDATWRMARKDLPDQSPSSYDMSLLTQAAAVGWPDVELHGLMLVFRRTNKLDTSKAMRPDYVFRTISRARDFVAKEDSAEALDELGEALDEAKQTGDEEQVRPIRRAALDALSQQLAFELLHFIKYMSDPPAFAVVTPTITIQLGDVQGVLQWAKFRAAIYESIGFLIDRFKGAEWDSVARLISKAWEEQDVGTEATSRGELTGWLQSYLAQRPPVDTVTEAASSEYPFWSEDDHRVMLFGPGFKRWLWITYQERITSKDLGRRLREYGCEPDKINVTDTAGKRTSRGVWRLPAGMGSTSERD